MSTILYGIQIGLDGLVDKALPSPHHHPNLRNVTMGVCSNKYPHFISIFRPPTFCSWHKGGKVD